MLMIFFSGELIMQYQQTLVYSLSVANMLSGFVILLLLLVFVVLSLQTTKRAQCMLIQKKVQLCVCFMDSTVICFKQTEQQLQ